MRANEIQMFGEAMHGGQWSSKQTDALLRIADENNDGEISVEEWLKAYEHFLDVSSMSDEEFGQKMEMFKAAVLTMNRREFDRISESLMKLEDEQRVGMDSGAADVTIRREAALTQIFDACDVNGNGLVSHVECAVAVCRRMLIVLWRQLDAREIQMFGEALHEGEWSAKQTEALLRKADANQDGQISVDEWLKLYRPFLDMTSMSDGQFERKIGPFKAAVTGMRQGEESSSAAVEGSDDSSEVPAAVVLLCILSLCSCAV